jgi:hypothetical protein
MLILIAKHKYSISRALKLEFESIRDRDRLKEIYITVKELGFTEEAADMHSDLVSEGIVQPYTF